MTTVRRIPQTNARRKELLAEARRREYEERQNEGLQQQIDLLQTVQDPQFWFSASAFVVGAVFVIVAVWFILQSEANSGKE